MRRARRGACTALGSAAASPSLLLPEATRLLDAGLG